MYAQIFPLTLYQTGDFMSFGEEKRWLQGINNQSFLETAQNVSFFLYLDYILPLFLPFQTLQS